MKRPVLLMLSALLALSAYSQIAKWLIRPQYDSIAIVEGQKMIITEKDGMKSIWNFDGQPLTRTGTQDDICSFHDGHAVVIDQKDKTHITGFYGTGGSFTPLDYIVANSSPRFSDGYLLVKMLDGKYYQFIGTNGQPADYLLVSARPFNRGYASCETYGNMQKEKDLYPLLLSASTMQPVVFRYGNEDFKRDDINFISSVNDQGKGIVICKERVYLFDAQTRALTPVYTSSTGPVDKKDKIVKITDKQQVVDFSGGTPMIRAFGDKHRSVMITLDEMNAPLSIQFTDNLVTYTPEVEPPHQYTSLLNKQRDEYPSNIYSLYWGDSLLVLPTQLDDVGQCFNDQAFIKVNGRWGMVKVYPDKKFEIILNKGESIGFRHKTFKTTIQLNTPGGVGIAPEKDQTSLELRIVGKGASCNIEDYSRSDKGDGTRPGYVRYDCELDFPEGGFEDSEDADESDEYVGAGVKTTPLKYYGQVEYHGLLSPVIPFETRAYHDKYITTDVDDGSYFENSCYYFTLRLSRSADSENKNFPLDINCTVSNDSGYFEVSKEDIYMASADKYEITVRGIVEGSNTIGVNIVEENTPGLETYFEFKQNYQRPRRTQERQQAAKPKIQKTKKKSRVSVTRNPTKNTNTDNGKRQPTPNL